jgi:ABC-type microcin C transport system permease subunit YejB
MEVLRQEYLRTAHAKGLPEGTVILRHAVKNALLPVVTVLGIAFGDLLSGSMIVETNFAWPGIGRYAVAAILLRDYQVIQACVLYMAVTFVVLNFLVDVCYRWLDPRLHFGAAGGRDERRLGGCGAPARPATGLGAPQPGRPRPSAPCPAITAAGWTRC